MRDDDSIRLDTSTASQQINDEEQVEYGFEDCEVAVRQLQYYVGENTNLIIADKEGDKTRKYKQWQARDIVNNLEVLKVTPDNLIPQESRGQYRETCRWIEDEKDTYVHQEVLDRILQNYEEETKAAENEELNSSHLKRTAFYIEMFDELTNNEINAYIINRHQRRKDIRAILTKVEKLQNADLSYVSSEMTSTEKEDSISQMTSTVKAEQTFRMEESIIAGEASVRELDPTVHLEDVFDVYDRLDSTISEFENRLYKHDSPEFVNLMETAKKLSELRDRASVYNPEKISYKEVKKELNQLMPTLYSQTQQYIQHCKDIPKSGSRRATRLKNAQRLLLVCEAYGNRRSVNDYLQDKIAESLLKGLTERQIEILNKNNELKEAAVLKKKYERPGWRKSEVEKTIKPHAAFKIMIRGAHDTFDLYHMVEKPSKTYKNFSKIFREYKANMVKEMNNAATYYDSKSASRMSSRNNSFTK